MKPFKCRREGVLLIDFRNCNPQGDPDSENRPRTDPETGHGFIRDAGIKRKIRDYLAIQGHPLYIARGACLESLNHTAAVTVGAENIFTNTDEDEDEEEEGDDKPKARKAPKAKKKGKATPETSRLVFDELAKKFIDFRLFGGTVPRLIGTGRGPIQFSFGDSVDPVTPLRAALTRVAVATEEEAEDQAGANRGMGGQWYIPYGLYRFHWYANPVDAMRTKMTEDDYELFLKSILNMFENDRSSGRVRACVRYAIEFKHKEHAGPGAISGERLLELVRVERKDRDKPARSYGDYNVTLHPLLERSQDFERRILIEPISWDDRAAE